MNTLYTLGYTGIKPAQLLAKAIELQAIVIDTRYSPRSRTPQWNGMELARLLGQRYQHLPALGNVNYKTAGPIEINLPKVGTQQMISILNDQAAILLCACPDVSTCHRKIVAEMVQAACGCEVIHLAKGDLASDDPAKPDKPMQQNLF
jgi:uncharacterized protein (DUF488 family)